MAIFEKKNPTMCHYLGPGIEVRGHGETGFK